MRSKRVILDTNLWISFLISKRLSQIDALIENQKIVLIFSNELIEEFVDVVSLPKFKAYFTPKDIERVLENFDQFGKLVKVTSDIKMCRDGKDDFLLSLSVDSEADYLITGDADLLVLAKIGNTKIMSFSDFIIEILDE